MATPEALFKLTWRFDLYLSGAITEYAELGIWFDFGSSPAVTSWDAALGDEAQNGADIWHDTATGSMYPTSVHLRDCVGTRFNTNGSIAFEQSRAPGSAWAGTDSAGALPWQLSQVVSLYTYTPGTFIARGKTRRGRVYGPPMAKSLLGTSDNGVTSTGQVDALLEDYRQLIAACSTYEPDDPGHGATPVVYSRMRNEVFAITDLASDVVLDTQRRRTKSEPRTKRSITYHV